MTRVPVRFRLPDTAAITASRPMADAAVVLMTFLWRSCRRKDGAGSDAAGPDAT
jgi:hypothetical protein